MSLMVMINVLLLLLIVAIFHDDYDEMHAYDHLFVLSETVGYFTHTHTHTHTHRYILYIYYSDSLCIYSDLRYICA